MSRPHLGKSAFNTFESKIRKILAISGAIILSQAAYAKAFPPTLIQGGTREVLLSDFVREYQALRGGGHEAVLDLYEGMPHVFQAYLAGTPEEQVAIGRAKAFLDGHLAQR